MLPSLPPYIIFFKKTKGQRLLSTSTPPTTERIALIKLNHGINSEKCRVDSGGQVPPQGILLAELRSIRIHDEYLDIHHASIS